MSSNTEDHTSIPLIYLSSQNQGKFILNPKAIQLIQSYNSSNQTTFISICGDYRSGKSFLMNSLFFSKQGFKVSPTTQPCTKGINIWSKPMTYNGKNIWILDTQGFGAIDRDDSYDVKIFLLTTLISNIVMYNSFGALDENTINKFAAICHKAESLDKGIKKIKMFWILRDFSLSIENRQGRALTADEYLEGALEEDSQSQQLLTERQAIKRVFGERHCIPLVRPVIDETILSQLSEIKFQQLRGQFVEQVYKLRKKLLSCIESKIIEGVRIDGNNLSAFLMKYLEVLNQNQVETDVSSTWQKIVEYEKEKQEAIVRGKLREILSKEQQKIPFTLQTLSKTLQQSDKLIDVELRQFSKHFTNQQYLKQSNESFLKYIVQTREQTIQKNLQLIKNEQKKYVKGLFQNVQKQIGKEGKVDDNQLIMKYLQKLFKTKQEYVGKFGKYLQKFNLEKQKDSKMSTKQRKNSLSVSKQTSTTGINCNGIYPTRQELVRISELLSQSTNLIYYEHFYHQQKLTFPKILGQLSQQLAVSLSRINQQRKTIKAKDIDLKVLKQQKEKLHQDISQLNKEITKLQSTKLQLSKQLQLKHHQISTIATKSQNQYIKLKSQYEQSIQQLKQTILSLQKNFLSIKKQNELEKMQSLEKLTLEKEKNQLMANKLEQARILGEKAVDQLKQQYEDKIKKEQEKYQQLQNNLNLQRKKFLQLNKTKKQEQAQLLEDLAEKNQKLLALRREITNIEHIYKEQLDSIMRDQKLSLQQQFSLQLEEKEHLIHVLQQKLQQCIIRIQQLQQTDTKYQTVLMEHRLLSQQHINVVEKYKEIVNKLKKSTLNQQQKDTLFGQIKDKYQTQIKAKEQLLKKFKLQIKQSEQLKIKQLQQLEAKYLIEMSQMKQSEQETYEEKIKSKISQLQNIHKSQKSELLQKLKQSYSEIEQLKTSKVRLESDVRYAGELVNKLERQFKIGEKQVKEILRKYRRLGKEQNQQKSKKQSEAIIADNQKNRNGYQQQGANSIVGLQSQLSSQQQSNILQNLQSNVENVDASNINIPDLYQNTSNGLLFSRQNLNQVQSQFLHLLNANKSLTEQLQDLKHSFKQTISQLQECQSHINSLNTKIKQHQLNIQKLSLIESENKQAKRQLHEKILKLQSLQKATELLKKQVELRDEIYMKRQSSIKENLQLYKQTIANLTLENQHLNQKSTKLEIQLNRFTEWEADFSTHSYNNNKTKSNLNLGSLEFMADQQLSELHQHQQGMYSFGEKINKLQKQNRKLKKELHQQKELTLNTLKPSSTNSLTNILTDNTSLSQLQSLKKQNTLFKKRVEQLRQRQLKLLQEIKTVKSTEKQSNENKLNLVREEFQAYRKRTKQEIVSLQRRIDELTQEKYRLKQEMLVMRQDRGLAMIYSTAGKAGSNHYNVADKHQNNEQKGKIQYTSNKSPALGMSQQPTVQQYQSLFASSLSPSAQTIESYEKAIQTLKQENTRLLHQISLLNNQLTKQKDESDKKLASLQVFYEQQIRLLESEKSRIDLENQKNKTKYEHLLKVNNDLILEVDNFKAKANNQLTLKEKYKTKISALFQDDD